MATLIHAPAGVVSLDNSTTASLASNASWTGSFEDVSYFSSMLVACKTDQSGSLTIEFSPDSENIDSSLSYSVAAGTNEIHRLSVTRKWARVKYLNTSPISQSYFRLQTLLGQQSLLTSNLNSSIQTDADAVITRGILTGKTDGGTYLNVPVTQEGHLEVAIHGPRLPFGSIHAEKLTPIFQTDAVYGLNVGEVIYGSTNSGNVITTQSMFQCSTGTTVYSQAYLQSRRRLRYRPGQGIVARFTGVFSNPVSESYQVIGIGHAEDGIYIGYSGSSFGILHSVYGVREQQLLNITTPSSANQNVIVTLNGVTSSIAVTNANNANRLAWELSQGTYSGWKAEPTGSAVLFTADSVGNKAGIFNISGSAGVTGSFNEIQRGVATTETFISQSNWNGDKLDGTGASAVILNPQFGNVFEIGLQYLGFGSIVVKAEVSPEDGNNSDFVTLHTIKYANSNLRTSFGNPAFPFSIAVYSAGSNDDLSVKVGSFAGFIEGDKKLTGNRFTYRSSVTSVSTALFTDLFTVYNSRRFGGRTNQSVVNCLSVGYAAKLSANAYGEFFLIKNGSLVGNPNFINYSPQSCTLFDTGSTSVTFSDNQQVVFSIPISETSDGVFTFAEQIDLQPGEWISAACKLGAGTANFANISLNTIEDQ